MSAEEAYSRGYAAGLRVKNGEMTGAWRDNPFSRTSDLWAAWQRGFNAAIGA